MRGYLRCQPVRHAGKVAEVNPIKSYAKGLHQSDSLIETGPSVAFFPVIVSIWLDVGAAAEFGLCNSNSLTGRDQSACDHRRLKRVWGWPAHFRRHSMIRNRIWRNCFN